MYYLFEIPVGQSSNFSNFTHEIALSYDLIQVHPDSWCDRRSAIVW